MNEAVPDYRSNMEAGDQGLVIGVERTDSPGETPSTPTVHHTFTANLTGQPALSVSCGFTANRVPIGVQLEGRPFDEATLFRIARA